MNSEDLFHLGAKAFIFNDDGQLLLLKQNPKRSINTKDGYWDIPGGRMQKNETLETTLRREIYEETGIDKLLTLDPFLMVLTDLRIQLADTNVGLIFATYLCSIPNNSPICLSDEHINFQWVKTENAITLLERYPRSLLDKLSLIKK